MEIVLPINLHFLCVNLPRHDIKVPVIKLHLIMRNFKVHRIVCLVLPPAASVIVFSADVTSNIAKKSVEACKLR